MMKSTALHSFFRDNGLFLQQSFVFLTTYHRKQMKPTIVKFRVFLVMLLIQFVSSAACAQSTIIKNPILPGFNPDPSICRVGEYYYICNSSFTWYPGLPISRSKDLKHWELVAHAIDRPGMVTLNGVKDKDGVWAPTIRHHDGKWYIFCNVSNGGNFFITADDVCGPWSDPIYIKGMPGIDPSIFWDKDGRSYVLGNHGSFPDRKYRASTAIWIQEIDLKNGKLIGERHYISTGHAFNAKYAEGPHLYRIDGKYVLLVAEGGTDFFHAATVMTSDHLFGPYLAQQINPVLSQRQQGHSAPIQCVGHCDLVDTPDGKWYAVALGKRMMEGRHTFTRETFICPVELQQGELVFNPGFGYMTPEVAGPSLSEQTAVEETPLRDDFEGDKLVKGWYYNRIPSKDCYTLSDGQLRLNLLPECIDSLVCPSLLMRKTLSHSYSVTARMTFSTRKVNEEAGLMLHRNNTAYVALLKGRDGLQVVVNDNGIRKVVQRIPYQGQEVVMRLTCNGLLAVFSYGETMDSMTSTMPVSLLPLTEYGKVNRFNGLGVGLYASSNGKKTKSVASFDYFDYVDTPEGELQEAFKVTDEEMQRIYEEVKTPYKYDVVISAPGKDEMVDCPTVFRSGDRWIMTYVRYDGRGYETWMASSTDLLHWKTEGRLMAFADEGWDKDQRGGFPALQNMEWEGDYRLGKYNDKYWMTYIGGSKPGYETAPLSIGIASTKGNPGEAHLWATEERPVMAWNDAAVKWWETYSPYKSLVYETANPFGSRFIMFYNAAYQGKQYNRGERIGIATSDDLKHWTRYSGNPIFQHDFKGTITGDAYLQRIGSLYVMFYFCAHNPQQSYKAYNSFAVSRDLVHWRDWEEQPLVVPSTDFDGKYSHKSAVVKWNGMVYHFYCAVSKEGRRTIALATSRDMK